MPNTDRCASHAHEANNCCSGFSQGLLVLHLSSTARCIPNVWGLEVFENCSSRAIMAYQHYLAAV